MTEIAEKRSLKEGTIFTHLTYYVAQGALKASDIIGQDKVEVIAKCIKDNNNFSSLTELKHQLSNEISYNDIRLVVAEMRDKNT